MTSRNCSDCTACCEGWISSKHIEMSPGNPCRHCTEKGCAIYENRPEDPCRTFNCAWLRDPDGFPDTMRPDLCGAIVSLGKKWHQWPVILAVPRGEKIPGDTLDWLKAYASERRIPLLFIEREIRDGQYVDARQSGYGPPAFAHAVKNEITSEDVTRF